MKKFLSILLVVFTLMTVFSVAGAGLSYYTVIEDPSGQFICIEKDYLESIYIDEYIGNDTRVVVPSEIAGYKVEAISMEAFAGNEKIEAVELPETVVEIHSGAFKSCTNLKEISVMNNSIIISDNSFEGTAYYNDKSNWKNDALYINKMMVAVKPEVSGKYVIKDGTTAIAQAAFAGNTKLTEVVIPDTVTFLPYGVFEGCSSLKKVTMSENTEYIDFSVFENCVQLSEIVIPASVRNIEMDAFLNCKKLKSIKIESKDLDIYDNAFEGTAYLNDPSIWYEGVCYIDNHILLANPDVVEGDLKFKEGTTSISSGAFGGCDKLTSVTIPKGVTTIRENTFGSCNNLKRVVIPHGVKSMERDVFAECENLVDITLPDSIETFGWNVFDDTAYFNDKNNWKNGVLYIGNYLIGIDEGFKAKEYTVKEGTKAIGAWGMAGSETLEKVIIPDSVVAINEQAFNTCENLKTAIIPDSVRIIGHHAFVACENLVIHTSENSFAHTYAKANNIKFVSTSDDNSNEKNEDKEIASSESIEDVIEVTTKINKTDKNTNKADTDINETQKSDETADNNELISENSEEPVTSKTEITEQTNSGAIIMVTIVILIGLIAVASVIICKKRK